MPTQVVITPEVVQGCTHGHVPQQVQPALPTVVQQQAGLVQSQQPVIQPQVQIIGNSVPQGGVAVPQGGVAVPQGGVVTSLPQTQPQIQLITNSSGQVAAAARVTPEPTTGLLTTSARTQGVAQTTPTIAPAPAASQGAPPPRLIQIPASPASVGTTGAPNAAGTAQIIQQPSVIQTNPMDVIDVPLTHVLAKDAAGNMTPLITPQGILAAFPSPLQQSIMQMVAVPQQAITSDKNNSASLAQVVVQPDEALPQQQTGKNAEQDMGASTSGNNQFESQQPTVTAEVNSETMALATSMADQIIENLLESASTMAKADEAAVDSDSCCSRCKCNCSCDCGPKKGPSTTTHLEMNTPTFEVTSPPSFS